MKKFLVTYLAPTSVIEEWKKTDPQKRKAAETEMQGDWKKWMTNHANIFVDKGAGVGKTRRVTAQGSAVTLRSPKKGVLPAWAERIRTSRRRFGYLNEMSAEFAWRCLAFPVLSPAFERRSGKSSSGSSNPTCPGTQTSICAV
jgi:hypothetical protein